ncbi:MAG: hypothetical protein M1837_003163 [Sclerophora amabilis]|nr:MAG: hypothetical protein M1837_003163 [Sclerophora amabilis]
MAKDKSVNPAQAQRKLEKQKFLKKGKAEQAARRTEKLARRNPERLQRQLDDLRKAEESGQVLNSRDKKAKEELERDVKAVTKAREALGEKAPQFSSRPARGDRQGGRGGGGAGREGGSLGKRRRDSSHADGNANSERSTPESVRNIPMPRDSPPPIPPEFQHLRNRGRSGNANLEPLPPGGSRIRHSLPSKPEVPQVQTQTVYEAKPIVRDLRKEAVSAFTPAAVRRKIEATKGVGGRLLEPEEAEALEKEGYGEKGRRESGERGDPQRIVVDAAPDVGQRHLEEEEERFEREMRGVQIEEVEDEDA